MSMGLLAWSVLCIGMALVISGTHFESLVPKNPVSLIGAFLVGGGFGSLLWALGIGMWLLTGLVF